MAAVPGILSKLEEQCNKDGDFYSALQKYKVHFNRNIIGKRDEVCLNIISSGVETMLKHQQWANALELSQLLKELLIRGGNNNVYGDRAVEMFSEVYAIMTKGPIVSPASSSPSDMKALLNTREEFTKTIFVWSRDSKTTADSSLTKRDVLHKVMALILLEKRDFSASYKHFIHTADADGMSTLLVQWIASDQAAQHDADLFILRTVLHLLSVRSGAPSVDAARQFVAVVTYKLAMQDVPQERYEAPMVHFGKNIIFLASELWKYKSDRTAADGDKVVRGYQDAFQALRDCYRSSYVARDENMDSIVDAVGESQFGIKRKKATQSGSPAVGSMMSMLSSLM